MAGGGKIITIQISRWHSYSKSTANRQSQTQPCCSRWRKDTLLCFILQGLPQSGGTTTPQLPLTAEEKEYPHFLLREITYEMLFVITTGETKLSIVLISQPKWEEAPARTGKSLKTHWSVKRSVSSWFMAISNRLNCINPLKLHLQMHCQVSPFHRFNSRTGLQNSSSPPAQQTLQTHRAGEE